MISLQPELEQLRPRIGDVAADALIARERREIFSVYPELRLASWLGVALLATAAGIFLKENFERIGPTTIAALVAFLAAGCYAFVTWRRDQESLLDAYVLLLGALLVSADVAFIESQFHLLDDAWKHHLLLLAVLHGITAYTFESRMVLSLSITSFAAWMGVERNAQAHDLALPAFGCAVLLVVWREVDVRLQREAFTPFSRSFEHFAANIALLGSLTLLDDRTTRGAGAALTVAIAALVIWWGFRSRSESFVLYAVVYAVIAVAAFLILTLQAELVAMLILIAAVIGTIVALLMLHARFKELAP